MEIPSKKFYRKLLIETIDDWLRDEGYCRKISPKDPTCLFRAVSEQVYMTQYYHIKVRKECVEFMRKNKDLFEKNIPIVYDNYLDQLACITEWGGHNEIEAMSLIYKKEFIIYNSAKMMKKTTNNGFNEFIYLCLTPPKHYESVYNQKKQSVAAFCQSITYKLLYEDVFQMPDVDHAVEKMLHSPPQNNSQNKFMPRDNFEIKKYSNAQEESLNEEEPRIETCRTITPFPYRVAKALDPNIYRNIDYDIWLEIKREIRNAGWVRWNNYELQVGGKCLVQVNYGDEINDKNAKDLRNAQDVDNNGNISLKMKSESNKESTLLIGHIQEMSRNEGPVIVFIEELGEKKTVPYEALKPLQQEPRRNKSFIVSSVSPKKNYFDQNSKWRKQLNSYTRKPRNLVTNSSNIPILSSHVDSDALDNTNNNNNNINVDSGNDSSDSVNVKQSITLTANNYHNSEFHTTDSTILKNRMDVDNYLSCQENSLNGLDNIDQVQSLLTSPKNIEPMLNSDFSEEDYEAKSCMPNNNNQNNLCEKNIKNNLIDGNGNNISMETSVSITNDNLCSNTSEPQSIYQGNLNIVCVSPEGNVYAPFFYLGNNFVGPSITGMLNCASQPVNFGAQISVDANGNDLPYSDISTLRFFFNLGIEYFRCNQMWAANGSPMPCPPTFIPNEENAVPMGVSCHPNSPPMPVPNENTHQQYENNVRRQVLSPTRKNERTFNNRVNIKPNGNSKMISPRKYCQDFQQDLNKNRNEGFNHSYDYHKSKYTPKSSENRDPNFTSWDSRKNKGTGQFKKLNDDRNRTEKSYCHYDHQKKPNSFNNYANNKNNNNSSVQSDNSYEDQKFAPKTKHYDNQGLLGQQNQIQSPTNSSVSSVNHQTSFAQQSPPVFASMPYYPNELENMYPLPGNMYPIPYISHPDSTDGNNMAPYCCPGLDNYQQPITSLYPQIPFSPSSVLPSPPPPPPPQPLFPTVVPPNSSENWYIPGQPHFIHYPHFSVPSPLVPPPPPPQNSPPC